MNRKQLTEEQKKRRLETTRLWRSRNKDHLYNYAKSRGWDNKPNAERLWVQNNKHKISEYNKKQYQKRKGKQRDRRLQLEFGISTEIYNSMLFEQNGKCALCKQSETRLLNGQVKNLAVDHDHGTGKVRRLLCSNCNVGLGNFQEKIELLKAAIVYLKTHREI